MLNFSRNAEPFQRVVRISPNGALMATGGTDGYIRLWNFPQMTKLHDLVGHSKEIDDIDFSPKSKQLATVAKDGKLIIWDVTSGSKIKELTWTPSDDEKSFFKRCRFRKTVADSAAIPQQLFALSKSLPPRDRRNRSKTQYGYLQLWSVDLGQIEKLVTYKEDLSALAVSDDGKFVAVGTMSSGTVDMFIAFSLQKVWHVPGAHRMFITDLEFLPTKLDGPAITSNAEAAVVSCSVDNKICIHSIPFRRESQNFIPAFWIIILLPGPEVTNFYFFLFFRCIAGLAVRDLHSSKHLRCIYTLQLFGHLTKSMRNECRIESAICTLQYQDIRIANFTMTWIFPRCKIKKKKGINCNVNTKTNF